MESKNQQESRATRQDWTLLSEAYSNLHEAEVGADDFADMMPDSAEKADTMYGDEPSAEDKASTQTGDFPAEALKEVLRYMVVDLEMDVVVDLHSGSGLVDTYQNDGTFMGFVNDQDNQQIRVEDIVRITGMEQSDSDLDVPEGGSPDLDADLSAMDIMGKAGQSVQNNPGGPGQDEFQGSLNN